jgi:hypothetical protein
MIIEELESIVAPSPEAMWGLGGFAAGIAIGLVIVACSS